MLNKKKLMLMMKFLIPFAVFLIIMYFVIFFYIEISI